MTTHEEIRAEMITLVGAVTEHSTAKENLALLGHVLNYINEVPDMLAVSDEERMSFAQTLMMVCADEGNDMFIDPDTGFVKLTVEVSPKMHTHLEILRDAQGALVARSTIAEGFEFDSPVVLSDEDYAKLTGMGKFHVISAYNPLFGDESTIATLDGVLEQLNDSLGEDGN